MSKQELIDYYDWYLNIIPERIAILEKAVQNTRGFSEWKANYTPKSLDDLGRWFYDHVETRKHTKEELDAIRAGLPVRLKDIEIGDRELTNKTFSIAIDTGMYLSQVFFYTVARLEWQHQLKGSQRSIDYGQPVIAGAGKLVFNPVHMLIVLAYSFADNTRSYTELHELYDIWKNLLEGLAP